MQSGIHDLDNLRVLISIQALIGIQASIMSIRENAAVLMSLNNSLKTEDMLGSEYREYI